MKKFLSLLLSLCLLLGTLPLQVTVLLAQAFLHIQLRILLLLQKHIHQQ